MDSTIQIIIFVLFLVFSIFSKIAKDKKRKKDFEWEGDGVLEEIIKNAKHSGQDSQKEWEPWLADDDSENDDVPWEEDDSEEVHEFPQEIQETFKTSSKASSISPARQPYGSVSTEEDTNKTFSQKIKTFEPLDDGFEVGMQGTPSKFETSFGQNNPEDEFSSSLPKRTFESGLGERSIFQSSSAQVSDLEKNFQRESSSWQTHSVVTLQDLNHEGLHSQKSPVNLEKILSAYTPEQLLVVLPTILHPPASVYGKDENNLFS